MRRCAQATHTQPILHFIPFKAGENPVLHMRTTGDRTCGLTRHHSHEPNCNVLGGEFGPTRAQKKQMAFKMKARYAVNTINMKNEILQEYT